ncbi:MAG: sugar phosphate isomerase/epimerase family protein [Opitutales bacterium]
MRLLLLLLTFGLCSCASSSPDTPAFFAMDTAARLAPAENTALLAELGYAGLGGRPSTARAHAEALRSRGLRLFNAYHVARLDDREAGLPADLARAVDDLAGLDAVLWLAIQKVELGEASASRPVEQAREAVVDATLRRLLEYAGPRMVRISLYPHAGFWGDRFETCLRTVERINDPRLTVTFNLCHWLKVDGGQADPMPLIRRALPRMAFVTINGADAGDTAKMGWDRLIQPLGRGSYDVKAFVSGVRAAGYRGPFGFQGYGIRAEPAELLRQTMEGWRTILR